MKAPSSHSPRPAEPLSNGLRGCAGHRVPRPRLCGPARACARLGAGRSVAASAELDRNSQAAKAEPSAQVPARLRPLRPEPVDAASATPAALALGGTCAPPERVNGSAMVHAAEAGYRRCCERKWSSRLADGASARSLCSAVSGVAAPSTLRCHPVPGSIPGPDGAFPIWFCEATRVALNLGGNGGDLLRRFNYSRPTVSNANVYPPGALQLRGCALSSAFSTLDFGSKGLSRILPRAVGVSELPPPSQLSDENLVGGRLRSRVLTVLVVRMSPKNFYHGHFDFMHVFAIL
eukprot:CAMPEP_0179949888 /NCGR_PEP_ID=MMETSP0983-20121128/22604_1 /TAXON_ID=483367 /ORGANISM="non described non described, Strain CCMP 2436" /LENGTH=290 /DNA_ID=CAMNT_0021859715 /DNA_START=100 /DNA_END=970 /DNA_ORIENTATION=+